MERLEIFPLKITTSQVLLTFAGCPGGDQFSRTLFSYLQQRRISVTLLVEAPVQKEQVILALVVDEQALSMIEAELEALWPAIGVEALMIEKPVAVIRILGPHFDIRPGIAGALYAGMAKAGIKMLVNSITGTTSLVVVHEKDLEMTQRELRAVFRTPKGK
ncbi:MAG: hypothetical protein RBS57_09165 [Desulforhabdus sp.]|jgi:aspartokinase|nr:hypothetical protein [Desulforhabdus sp.]